ncbi:hypothetical protein [Paraburkholderia strydomiana]|uniref:hypothetical protein n=1 Tax=Paraburkholderia strydomiana TaxID=1245417 RepID=UPI0038B8E153
MLRIVLPHHTSVESLMTIMGLADHLDAKDDLGRLPDHYWQAVLSAPTMHLVEHHLPQGESPLLRAFSCHSGSDVDSVHRTQCIPWGESDEVLFWAQHESWESPTETLHGLRIEIVPKIAFDRPDLFISKPRCPSLGETLVTEFRTLAADIAVQHPAFGFHPGAAPLSALSLFIGGAGTLDVEKLRSFVHAVFVEKGGAGVLSETIKRTCEARGFALEPTPDPKVGPVAHDGRPALA